MGLTFVGDRSVVVGDGHVELPELVANEIKAMQQRMEYLQTRTSSLQYKVDAFAQQVMDYSEGCPKGKVEFLEYCGIEVPTESTTFTIEVTHYVGTEPSDIVTDINDCISSGRDSELIQDWDTCY